MLLKNILYAFFTGFLVFISYPKISFYPLTFIALVPYLILILNTKSKKEAIIYGFITGFFIYIFILYWIVPTLKAGEVNLVLSIISLILLSSILSIEFIIISLFTYQAKIFGSKMIILITPSIWIVIDFLKTEITKFIAYFPWFELAYSQWNNPLIISLASYGQSYLITYLIVIINIFFAYGLISKNTKTKINNFLTAILLIVSSHLIGYYASKDIKNKIINSKEFIKVSIIQPSIDFYIKWDPNYIDLIKTKIEKLIKDASLQKPNLIIWPENALYGWIDDPEVFEWLCKNIKISSTYHIVGSVSKKDSKHVSLYILSPQCNIEGEYHKRVLVPFGEYVPMRGVLNKYISVIGSLGEFEPGSFSQKPIIFKNKYIAPTICYETIFKYLFFPQESIDFIINITNDGWYLTTSAPYQHFAAAILRAIENRRVLIRAANNGISAIIYPDGTIKKILKLNEYDTITDQIPILTTERQSSILRYWLCIVSCMITFAFTISLPLKK
ncbi:MAG: apolipoprotein N-acyltransferase [Elusimicrobiales bacterium]|nr:apolipoprotein N-acyltransferase [Elusimicrobiales bacterium]